MSEQLVDVGREITLCYEAFGDRADPPALLVMGLATQMIAWPEAFCEDLAARGLYVVRFDNRDVGRSTHIDGAPPSVGQLIRRSRGAAHYSLADMAQDAVGLLEALGLGPAHVIGASMGGMIAQTMAARHPECVRSLVSIMSTTGSRRAGQPALRMYPMLLRRPSAGREAYAQRTSRVFAAIGSTGLPRDDQAVREMALASYDRDHDPHGPGRQLAAILAAGDRTAEVRRIRAPTLVIHGSADPLVAPSGGRVTARAVTGARMLEIEGMGHDLPPAAWPQLIEAIADHVAAADASLSAA